MPLTRQSLVICHNAVGSIQAKNSEQARALAQCLGELEAEMQAHERSSNVVVMDRKDETPTGPSGVPQRGAARKREQPLRQNGPAAEGSTQEN
jgi:hypothetical protein